MNIQYGRGNGLDLEMTVVGFPHKQHVSNGYMFYRLHHRSPCMQALIAKRRLQNSNEVDWGREGGGAVTLSAEKKDSQPTPNNTTPAMYKTIAMASMRRRPTKIALKDSSRNAAQNVRSSAAIGK